MRESTFVSGKPVFVVIDCETSGLDVEKSAILELGILLLDASLDVIDEFTSIVVSDHAIQHLDHLALLAEQEPTYRGQEPWFGGKLVHEMHQKSGLADQIRKTHAEGIRFDLFDLQAGARDFLRGHGIDRNGKLARPMVGSSVQFDRKFLARWMPALEDMFHYRNIDVSTIKGITDTLRADVAAERAEKLRPQGLHRSLPDCYDTRDELAFYLDRFFSKEATSDV